MRQLIILVICTCAVVAYGNQKPAVNLAGIGSAGVKLTTAVGRFSFSYPLEATEDVTALTVAVDDFHGPNDTIVRPEVSLDGKAPNVPVDVKQSDRPVLRIAGVFPYAGDYSSNIMITHGGARKVAFSIAQ
jgi:hypothetical protein